MKLVEKADGSGFKLGKYGVYCVGYWTGRFKTSEKTDTRLFTFDAQHSIFATVRDDGMMRFLVRGQYYDSLAVAMRYAKS
jgi:hypothetical protein